MDTPQKGDEDGPLQVKEQEEHNIRTEMEEPPQASSKTKLTQHAEGQTAKAKAQAKAAKAKAAPKAKAVARSKSRPTNKATEQARSQQVPRHTRRPSMSFLRTNNLARSAK